MLEWFFIGLAVALGGGSGGKSADPDFSEPTTTFAAEDQTPTGKFTTAAEIKPIVEATRGNWVAVREYEGQDWLYLSHLLAWRCGMHEFRVGVNGGPLEPWDMPPCQLETATPNAIPSEAVIYRTFAPGSVQSVEIEILYDDLDTARGSFERKQVLIP